MPTVRSILCSEGMVRDVDTDRISLFNILDEIKAPGFPLYMQMLCVFIILDKEKTDENVVECLLKAANESGELLTMPLSPAFNDKKSMRLMVRLFNVVIPSESPITLNLLYKEKELGSFRMNVLHVGKPKAVVSDSSTDKPTTS